MDTSKKRVKKLGPPFGRIPWNKGKRTDYTACGDCGKIRYAAHGSPRCQECWNKLTRHPNSLSNLKPKSSEWMREHKIHLGKKHSDEVKKRMSAIKQGLSLTEWRGYIKSINDRVRATSDYKNWRVSVFERDNFICQICGQRGKQLQADHIKPFAKFPDLRFDIDNGRTLCVNCHKTTDTYMGRTRWMQKSV